MEDEKRNPWTTIVGAMDEVGVVILYFVLLVANSMLGIGLTEDMLADALWVVLGYLGLGTIRGTATGLFVESGARQVTAILDERLPKVTDLKSGTGVELPETPSE